MTIDFRDIKYWIEEHIEPIIAVFIISVLSGIIIFCAIPIKGTLVVDKTVWTWDIPVETYTAKKFDSLSRPPDDAYDIRAESEIYYTTETYYTYDSDGNRIAHEKSVPHTRTRYYYKRNVWVFEYNITSMGFDHRPYEKETSLPNDISNPNLGDKRRRPRKETYEVIGYDDSKMYTYKVSKKDWELIDKGGRINYKRHRFDDKIYEITFGEEK